MTTPQGGGYKSLNVTIRSALGLYANVRPCIAYYPFVETKYPGMDVVIVRENEEDLYTGIEYQQSQGAVHALKLISRIGSEKIIAYAFEYARVNKRAKVTCFVKDNIMKLSDGLFHKLFDEIGEEYPEIAKEHWIVDIGAAKLATSPKDFDVIVMPNLYGDILSDVAAQIAGSVGLAGSANIGDAGAMFEAIHGSAPRRAGQNIANPSGLIQSAILMLKHIGEGECAVRIENGWRRTLEEGIHTYDIFKEGSSKQKVGTREFAAAVAKRLGQKPETLKIAVDTGKARIPARRLKERAIEKKELVGIDLFIDYAGTTSALKLSLDGVKTDALTLKVIYNRGAEVWPGGFEETCCIDQYRLRYLSKAATPLRDAEILQLLGELAKAKIEVVATQNLYTFNGRAGYAGAS